MSPDLNKKSFSVKKQVEAVTSEEIRMKQVYKKHNMYVKETVPADRLLIWNLKDGWEPLCKFLDKPIPSGPIPHDNQVGDNQWIDDYILQSPVFKASQSYFVRYLLGGISRFGVAGFLI